MTGGRAIIGVCAFCALFVSALTAQGAAATSGTTAVTCKEEATAVFKYSDKHCKQESSGGNTGKFNHVAIAEETTTELTATDSGEGTSLKATIGGVATTLTSAGLTGTGSMENLLTGADEHYIHSTGTIVFSGVTVTPFTKCFVYNDVAGVKGAKEKVETEPLTATTEKQGDFVKVAPEVGEVLARLWILDSNKKTAAEGGECAIGATYTVTGSIKGSPNGATTLSTHTETTQQNTLKIVTGGSGMKAGIEGPLTLEGRTKGGGGAYAPLSQTTIEQ
ncbi:MAG TPA: hypothetical protein VMS60_07095 [Solirubrobacterales bacterium]|nr:hypothetical protein [Solirubrobacterales bacterium]